MTTVLDIGENADCKSYKEGVFKAKRVYDAEFAADLDINGRDTYSVIDCDADCIYNKSTHCTANNVDLKDGLFKTKCKTRVKN
jgi:hypothetical protein